eukprot:6213159-Pleurochrysis_carterae.AAC.4
MIVPVAAPCLKSFGADREDRDVAYLTVFLYQLTVLVLLGMMKVLVRGAGLAPKHDRPQHMAEEEPVIARQAKVTALIITTCKEVCTV